MSAIWVDRVGVAAILLAAGVFLARTNRAARGDVFGPRARTAPVCGTECGCGAGQPAPGRHGTPAITNRELPGPQ